MCGQWRHGERGRGGWLHFGIGYRDPFSCFSLPSCGFMAYLPVADFHLTMRGNLWQICSRDFDRGSRRKGISSRAPVLDQIAQRGLQVLGRFNTSGWPIKVLMLSGPGCAQNTRYDCSRGKHDFRFFISGFKQVQIIANA